MVLSVWYNQSCCLPRLGDDDELCRVMIINDSKMLVLARPKTPSETTSVTPQSDVFTEAFPSRFSTFEFTGVPVCPLSLLFSIDHL